MKRSAGGAFTPSSKRIQQQGRATGPPGSKAKATSRISPIEALPSEILEDIFLRCWSIDLLEASPRIAVKLSSNFIVKEFFTKIFTTLDHSDYPVIGETIHKDAKVLGAVQTYFLSRKAFSLALVRQCIPEFMTAVILKKFARHKLCWPSRDGDPLEPTDDNHGTIYNHMTDLMQTAIKEPFYFKQTPRVDSRWEDSDDRSVYLMLKPREGSVEFHVCNVDRPERKCTLGKLYVHRYELLTLSPHCQLPDGLLRNVWHEEKTELLGLLVQAHISVDKINSLTGEIAEDLFWEALKTRNKRVLSVLTIHQKKVHAKGENTLFGQNRRFGVVPRQEHLIFAIRNGCDGAMLQILRCASETEVDFQDVQVLRLTKSIESQPRRQLLEEIILADRVKRIR